MLHKCPHSPSPTLIAFTKESFLVLLFHSPKPSIIQIIPHILIYIVWIDYPLSIEYDFPHPLNVYNLSLCESIIS